MKRPGSTEKISISLPREDLLALKKRAKRLYEGNVSAVVTELAADARLLEGMHELVGALGGSALTDEARQALDAERSAPLGKRVVRKRPKKLVA